MERIAYLVQSLNTLCKCHKLPGRAVACFISLWGIYMYSESHLNILRQIDSNPHVSQRKLASNLGLSLGKVNYCVQALVEKGLLKVGNFSRSNEDRKSVV